MSPSEPQRKTAVLFDLGNTLVHYWLRPSFPQVLQESLASARALLDEYGIGHVSDDVLRQRARGENYEAADDRVRPLEGRLKRIFQLDDAQAGEVMDSLIDRFLQPFFARARRYDDTLPALEQIKAAGLRTAIVSNLPWGSPAAPWRHEVERQGLADLMDAIVFCSDLGWRKPAAPIFRHVLAQLDAEPQACLFVGDNPRWDIAGPRALGMDAVLIDRHHLLDASSEPAIEGLDDLLCDRRLRIRLPWAESRRKS